MNELEHYLKQATKGLWGRKKQEIWQELRANLNLRIQDLQVEGFSLEQATAQAIGEMGKPQEVSRGMQRVYVLPKAGLVAILTFSIAALSVLWINQTKAQSLVPLNVAYFTSPLSNDLISAIPFFDSTYLQNGLQAQGINVESIGGSLSLSFPNKNPFQVGMGTGSITDANKISKTIKIVTLFNLVSQAEGVGIAARLEGWETGVLTLDKSKIVLWSPQQPSPETHNVFGSTNAYNAYESLVQSVLQNQFKQSFMDSHVAAIRVAATSPRSKIPQIKFTHS